MTVGSTPCICDALRQTTRVVTRHYDDALRPLKLRITQYSVLAYLSTVGESRIGDVGADLLIEETTLTRSLKPLEDNGWIRSRQSDEDRRVRFVSITSSGRSLLAKARPLWAQAQARLTERLSQTTIADLLRMLPRVAKAAAK